MKSEDVSAELVEKAARADWDRWQQIKRDLYGNAPIAWGDAHESHRILHRNKVRPILAAVLPEYGARVLEEAAESFTEGGMVRRRLEDLARAARLTARDHCDGGCINPGSGDCPTCKAAATEELTDG